MDSTTRSGETGRRQRAQRPLRLHPDIDAALVEWSADEMRSVNAQIELILRDALRKAGRLPRV